MQRFQSASLAALAIAAAAASVAAQVPPTSLMVVNSGDDRVELYSAFDGSLIDPNFIVDANNPATFDFSTPKEAIQVGNEIWVSDQLNDFIAIFDLQGAFQATISGGLDNIRGMETLGNTVYVSNSGTNNGAPGAAIVTIDVASRSITGNFSQAGVDPFDVEVYGGNLLVTDIDAVGGEGVAVFAPNGTFIEQLVSIDTSNAANGVDFPQQVHAKSSDTNFLVGGFSAPAGVYEYDSNGNQVGFWAPQTGQRGVFELGNGNYLFTNGTGTFVLDPSTGTSTQVGDADQYAGLLAIPEPASASLLAIGALGLLRRRRA